MRWILLLLLPLNLLAQETYDNCQDILPQNYQVEYDADKSYYWNVPNADIVSYNNNSITIQWPDSAGTYIISVYTTRFTCEGDTSYHEVIIKECPYLHLYFPTAFTPNEDTHNEYYQVGGKNADQIESMKIYNRWGEKIFEADYNAKWYGINCPIGVYSIVVFVNNNRYVKSITLLK